MRQSTGRYLQVATPEICPGLPREPFKLRNSGGWHDDATLVPATPPELEICMNDVIVARALHVIAVAIWIGGVSMVTTIVLPAVRRGELGDDWLRALNAIENRFAVQARLAVIVAGLTGLYMLVRLDLWGRFTSPQFWWMHAMVGTWLLFATILFVAEPFIVGQRFAKWATDAPRDAFKWLQRAHWVLLALSLITIFGAVAGSQGWSVF